MAEEWEVVGELGACSMGDRSRDGRAELKTAVPTLGVLWVDWEAVSPGDGGRTSYGAGIGVEEVEEALLRLAERGGGVGGISILWLLGASSWARESICRLCVAGSMSDEGKKGRFRGE